MMKSISKGKRMDKRQEWMVEKLVALEEFARLSNWMEVANLLRIASRAALGDLKHRHKERLLLLSRARRCGNSRNFQCVPIGAV